MWDFWNFENWNFNEFYSFSFTLDPMGVKLSKFYFAYKSQPKVFKVVLNEFSSQRSSQNYIWDWKFEFVIVNDHLFENFKSTISAYGKIKKNSSILKTSDRRAKRSEIWDLWVIVQHIWGTFGLVPVKVISRSFGVLSIFRNLDLMIRDRRKHFEWL